MTRAVLDACVLVPDVPRALLLAAAEAGHVTPLWSDRILEEWRRAGLRLAPEAAGRQAEVAAAMRAAFPEAAVQADPDLEATLSLPDPGDRHVLATAITGAAAEIVTFNLTDFPGRTLARHGLIPRHPDGFLVEILAADPGFATAIHAAGARYGAGSLKALLKRARLPRLAKAAAALA